MSDEPATKSTQLGRGALLGVALGALGGCLLLLFLALRARTGHVDCAGLPRFDCDIQRETSMEVARFESQLAAVLAAVSVAALLFFRTLKR